MTLAERIADIVADGGMMADASYRTRKPIAQIEAEWKRIVRVMGKQAR